MICNTCGTNNSPGNKFCSNCGEELVAANNSALNVCTHCGAENDRDNSFCITCGKKISTEFDKNEHSDQHNRNYKQNRKEISKQVLNNNKKSRRQFNSSNSLKTLWIIVGAVIVTVLILISFDLIFKSDPDKTPIGTIGSNPVVEAKVLEVASKFICSCGTCNEELLELCKCPVAVEERQFIRNYVEKNTSTNEVVIAVTNKYGWLEAEFASTFKVDPSRVWHPNKLIGSENLNNSNFNKPNIKATVTDKYTIYSAFNCPCRQCTIDELKDCNCPHPNGAKEVKRFIDNKLNENRYTVNEIIDLVAQTYGGKKA